MSGRRSWMKGMLLLSLIGGPGIGSPAQGLAATPCQGTYFSPTSLLTGAPGVEVIEVRSGAVSLSSCGVGRARVVERPAGTKLIVVFRSCAGLPGRARLVAQTDAASCTTMRGVFRSRRTAIENSFTASLGGSISGSVIVPETARADVDTADPVMDSDNDSFDTAQALPLAGTVGGAAGPDDGALDRESHRLSDIYRLSLDGSARSVTLTIADPAAADLDLLLVDAAGKDLSLGGPGESPAMHEAVRDARDAGVIVVVAAGNDDADAAGFSPAAFPEVVCVSAVDLQKDKAFYSNFGTVVDVAAPGGDIRLDRNGDGFADGVLSTRGDDSDGQGIRPIFTFFQGTSMASPHVAGVAALMQAAFMDAHAGARMTPTQFDVLLGSGVLTDTIGPDDFSGRGLINARKAVLAAAEPVAGDDHPVEGGAGGDVGHVFVRLLDPHSGATVAEAESDVTRGYRLSLGGPIPPGRYVIAAGTDRDGDGEIDDAGEAFGDGLVEVLAADAATIDLPVLERIGAQAAK